MNKQSGFGIASMVVGITSLVFSCFGVGLLGALGFIFAIVAFTQKDKAKGTAIAGLITSIIAFLISLFVVAAGVSLLADESSKETSKIESVDKKDSKDEKEESESKSTVYKDDDYTYEVKEFEIKNVNDVSCILIYSNFTNNSSDSVSADDNMILKAFQDGVELEQVYHSEYSEQTKNYSKKIKPGKSIEVCEIFQLSNKKSDVELEISNAFLIGGDTAKGTIKIMKK